MTDERSILAAIDDLRLAIAREKDWEMRLQLAQQMRLLIEALEEPKT